MKLSWSHAVVYVQDTDMMVDFYTDVLGFEVTDRGPVAENGPEIVFMSQDANDHHQIAFLNLRSEISPSNNVNHFAFRVENLAELRDLHRRIEKHDKVSRIDPQSHGNTVSIYFNDPEKNGIEVFWDTPWHVQQPQRKTWDSSLSNEELLAWVEEEFKHEPGFGPIEEYRSRRAAELGQ